MNSRGTIKLIAGGKGIHTFSKGINPKLNVIARLECELAYFDVQSSMLATKPLKQTDHFNFGMVTDLVGKLCIQTSCRPGEGWTASGYSCPKHVL